MNKKAFFGMFIGIVVGLILFFLFYFFYQKNTSSNNLNIGPSDSFFPLDNKPLTNEQNPSYSLAVDVFTDTEKPKTEVEMPKLRKVSNAPVSGYTSFSRKVTFNEVFGTSTRATTTDEIVYRYIDKQTGQIFETTNRSNEITRISNTTLGVFASATFLNQDSFIGRRFNNQNDSIETFIGSIIKPKASSTTYTTSGKYINPNISNISVFGNSLFSMYSTPTGSSGFISTPAGTKDSLIWSSPLSEINPVFVNKNNVVLTTKPSHKEDGYSFVLNTSTGVSKSLLGPLLGLTTSVNLDITALIYSKSNEGSFDLFYKNISKDYTLKTSSVTLPEKCVWGGLSIIYCAVPNQIPTNNYPDAWYKGLVAFRDRIVYFDFSKNIETNIFNIETDGGEDIDAINLSLSNKSLYLIFMDKDDNYLWALDLRQ
jgi:hypothetical protein